MFEDNELSSLDKIRLECLKLAHTHAKSVPSVLIDAEAYIAFVLKRPEAKSDVTAPDKVGQPDF